MNQLAFQITILILSVAAVTLIIYASELTLAYRRLRRKLLTQNDLIAAQKNILTTSDELLEKYQNTNAAQEKYNQALLQELQDTHQRAQETLQLAKDTQAHNHELRHQLEKATHLERTLHSYVNWAQTTYPDLFAQLLPEYQRQIETAQAEATSN